MTSIGMLAPFAFLLIPLVIAIVVCSRSARVQARFERRIDRKAKQVVARDMGVSYQYVDAVIENNRLLGSGRITPEEWQKRGMLIACRYPQDSGLTQALREAEFRK